nr:MAG TPA: Sodium/potassium-transporting ATPase subunit alpha-1 [Caudoviricetes sp.]
MARESSRQCFKSFINFLFTILGRSSVKIGGLVFAGK